MPEPEMSPDMPEVVHLHQTTAIDRDGGLGLAITSAPADGFTGGPPGSSEEMAERLGLEVVRSFEPTEEGLLAVLVGIVSSEGTEDALAQIDARIGGDPLADLEPRTREFVEHCAFAPIVAAEESRLSAKVLAAMVTGAGTICVGIVAVGAAPVLIAAGIGVGVVIAVAVLGPPALALGERLADAILPART